MSVSTGYVRTTHKLSTQHCVTLSDAKCASDAAVIPDRKSATSICCCTTRHKAVDWISLCTWKRSLFFLRFDIIIRTRDDQSSALLPSCDFRQRGQLRSYGPVKSIRWRVLASGMTGRDRRNKTSTHKTKPRNKDASDQSDEPTFH